MDLHLSATEPTTLERRALTQVRRCGAEVGRPLWLSLSWLGHMIWFIFLVHFALWETFQLVPPSFTHTGRVQCPPCRKAKALAQDHRVRIMADAHTLLPSKLSELRFRALYVAVVCLFVDELVGQAALMRRVEEQNRILCEVSLVGKWSPMPGALHDRVTNISMAIANPSASPWHHVVPLLASCHFRCHVCNGFPRSPLILPMLGAHTTTGHRWASVLMSQICHP
jgi:hypothetical protein